MYIRTRAGPAEVAFAVGDGLHGQGIATTMLAHLAEVAMANGIDRFVADVLPGNHRMVADLSGNRSAPPIPSLAIATRLGERSMLL